MVPRSRAQEQVARSSSELFSRFGEGEGYMSEFFGGANQKAAVAFPIGFDRQGHRVLAAHDGLVRDGGGSINGFEVGGPDSSTDKPRTRSIGSPSPSYKSSDLYSSFPPAVIVGVAGRMLSRHSPDPTDSAT
eukprot:CAMPEP_0197452526 /NCGR_PEP_ID=MMETSP1175-20131217/32296_1 /TAXON_ID=1003142 /ORGANISM="Triceratium dubium, Strain CCMP147" /LENGTH=131 /DNA_ID=CAMNT_0042985561 /DNA_START=565 /DNA_END=957 /DNA_ORIENTATION=+